MFAVHLQKTCGVFVLWLPELHLIFHDQGYVCEVWLLLNMLLQTSFLYAFTMIHIPTVLYVAQGHFEEKYIMLEKSNLFNSEVSQGKSKASLISW